ncbi:MAG: DoxX family protein [Chloroflexota bacterium]
MVRRQDIPFWLHLGSFLVRIGLGIVFFWTGNDLLTPPLAIPKLESRLGDLAEIGLVTPSTIQQVFQLIGHIEVAGGLLLIIGLLTRPAAATLAGLLAVYLLRTGEPNLFEVKDAALLSAALALALSGSALLSLDGFLAGRGSVRRMAAPPPRWIALLGPLLLRFGLSSVFLWSGVHMLTDPQAIVREMAQTRFIPDQPPFNQIDVLTLVSWSGIAHVVAAVLLLLGFLTKPVAAVMCIFIVLLMSRLGVFTLSMVKDLALAGVALSLATSGPGVLALDNGLRLLADRLRRRRRPGRPVEGTAPG